MTSNTTSATVVVTDDHEKASSGARRHGQVNARFLDSVDVQVREEILNHIGGHYGVDADEILAEVTDEEAESLLDYMVEPMRSAAMVIMVRHGFYEGAPCFR